MQSDIINPCAKDCPERTAEPNCHVECEKYKAFAESRREFNRQKNMWTKEQMPLPRGLKRAAERKQGRDRGKFR